MSGALAAFPAAPLDRTARLVTRGVWLLAVALGVAGVSLLIGGSVPVGPVLLAAGVLDAALIWHLGRLRPVEYVLEDGGLSVLREHASPKRFTGAATGARPGRLGMRVAGDGGGYGYLGRYRADGRTVHAFVTDRTRVVLLDIGATPLAISPADPETFLAEVARAA
jgi:hypothetical protein